LTNYQREKINITVNINYYGEYSQMMNSISYDFDDAWTSDIDISYQLDKDISISIGANNIFDTLPNTWDGLSGDFYGYDGIKPYSRYSPFGYSGAYYYFKASMKF
jgi:iron complex outermembrane receptor protein